MIPRRAFFFWEGPKMSHLRREGIESFKRHNPDWEVRIIDGAGIPIDGDTHLDIVHRSDWARYRVLYENGGVYFDTDMVFLRPVPEEWLNCELLLPVPVSGMLLHVAALGGIEKSPFFEVACHECEFAVGTGLNLGYQALGVVALTRAMRRVATPDTRWLKSYETLPIAWNKVDFIWNHTRDIIQEETIAIHWFGGDPLSQHMEPKADEEWMQTSDSALATLIRESRSRAERMAVK